uniref:Caudal type homeobox 1a n=1 Tax=Sphaeramia orbicularis TaxID=375764 RepID=A0A672YWF4_9TELE
CKSVAPHPLWKTRTKDKYRVVYTDQQRLELEREFQYNRYITMRRKTELSMALSLSERQVKIWFQNRRAKERKINRKKLQNSQQASTTTPTPPPHPEKQLEITQSHDSSSAVVEPLDKDSMSFKETVWDLNENEHLSL